MARLKGSDSVHPIALLYEGIGMTTGASCSTVIGFGSGASDPVAFETKTRSIGLPPKASADRGLQRLGTYVHKPH